MLFRSILDSAETVVDALMKAEPPPPQAPPESWMPLADHLRQLPAVIAPFWRANDPVDSVLIASAPATLVPRPETPVEIGRPVALVRVAAEGVPRLGVVNAGLVVREIAPEPLTARPSAVSTPVPVVTVDGAAPVPPPTIREFAASRADEDICTVVLNHGIAPWTPPVTALGMAMVPGVPPEQPTTPELL